MAEPRRHAVADGRHLRLLRRYLSGTTTALAAGHEQGLAPGGGTGKQGGIARAGGGIAVEDENVLAVVLCAHPGDVEEGYRGAAQRFAHGTVSLVVLLPRPGGRGEVDDRFRPAGPVHAQSVEHLSVLFVVRTPQVFAQLRPEAELAAAAPRHAVRNQPVVDRTPLRGRELAQGVEVAVVVEEAIVRVQGLCVRAAGHAGGETGTLHLDSVAAHVHRVEPAGPPVFPDVVGVEDNVAVHHGNALARLPQHFVPLREVAHQGVRLPGIADDVAGHTELGEGDEIERQFPRLLDHVLHARDVAVRPPRPHLHLGEPDARKRSRHVQFRPREAPTAPAIRSRGGHCMPDGALDGGTVITRGASSLANGFPPARGSGIRFVVTMRTWVQPFHSPEGTSRWRTPPGVTCRHSLDERESISSTPSALEARLRPAPNGPAGTECPFRKVSH